MRLPFGSVEPFHERTRTTTYCLTPAPPNPDQEMRAFLPLAVAATASRLGASGAVGTAVVGTGVGDGAVDELCDGAAVVVGLGWEAVQL